MSFITAVTLSRVEAIHVGPYQDTWKPTSGPRRVPLLSVISTAVDIRFRWCQLTSPSRRAAMVSMCLKRVHVGGIFAIISRISVVSQVERNRVSLRCDQCENYPKDQIVPLSV